MGRTLRWQASMIGGVDPLDAFLGALLPLLREHKARAAYLVGSRARGTADERSDIDVIIIADSDRPETERFKDYLPAILAPFATAVDLTVYTPAEFQRLKAEQRPFLIHALDGAKLIHEG